MYFVDFLKVIKLVDRIFKLLKLKNYINVLCKNLAIYIALICITVINFLK